ncbi:gliding motility-associated C-terminal domain-containing protein [Flavobacterium sp. 5]|uniref:DUF7507 domain-containing protein n=1 Tax=Flavobacterium sp. 5 TaxID=2035199 RepID=UPI000C2C3C04|nr:gliding motility-associated C-terminal domain-containing protein [Flavobacterium sp. 5]PKB18923.1 SprB-like repeat protein [Flavobacterium sp. 5]
MKTIFTHSAKLATILILSYFSILTAVSQTTPVIFPYNGFGIDGDLKANTPTSNIGDWIPGTGGAGEYVFQLNGTAVNTATTYKFTETYNSNGDNIFTGGGKFNDNPNTQWSWTNNKAGGKGDINNVLIHLGTDSSNNQWLIIASDRLVTTGTSYIDFEFFQNTLTANAGGSFTLAGGRTIGDILLSVEYSNGGSTATVKFYKWDGTDYALVNDPAANAFGKTNTNVVDTMTGGAFGSSQYSAYQFVEAAINISAFFAVSNPCAGAEFGSVLIKTKSSNSPTAALDDFAGPYPVKLILGTATISYGDGDFCKNEGIIPATLGGITGGTFSAPAGLSINPVSGSIDITNSTAGSYTVTYSFTTGGCPKTATTQVTVNALPVATINTSTNVSCFGGNNGQATTSVTGGTAAYTYSWNTTPVQNTAMATGLVAGTYTVTVTDAKGCTDTEQITISEPQNALLAAIGSVVDVNCKGDASGSATASATGGTADYSYSWNTTPVQNTAMATGLVAGTYTVTVTDAKGCTDTEQITISEPQNALLAAIGSVVDVNCKGDASGSATASATGGTADYTYSWNTTPVQNTAMATGLVAGTYTVTVTDAKGCTDTEQITISEPQNALLAAIGSVVDVNCKGDASGSATASATGGTADYTYSWNTTPIQNTAIATGLVAGTYTVTVTDAKGCTDTEQITINEPQNALLAAIGSVVDVNCKGDASGSATASATGGTADYSYSWNTTPVQNTAMATGLVAGTYTVTVTDAKGCTDTEQITISEPQNALLAAIGSVVDVNCKGDASGSATASATGGTADYTYSWNTTPIQNTAMATGLVAGTYTVTVTDAKGCTDTEQITISEPQNALLAAIGSVVDVNCKGDASGSATASATGGTADYTYSWNTTPVQNTAIATGLVAGTYTVTVTDAKGCTDTEQITINEPQNALLAAIGSVVDVNCKGDASGSATASATGGTADYSYSWNTTPVQNTAMATGLVAGTYTVTVTDAKGCTDTEQITISEPQNALLAAIGSVVDVNCKGDASGSATASATGGTADYSYSWNTTPVQNTAMATGLVAGTYTVTVTDAKGCTDTEQITISEPQNALLAAIGSVVDVNCKGDASGSATASATGGTADYTYSWNTTPIQNTAMATGLVAGTYTVTVTDAKGCTDTEQITISEPQNALLAAIGSVVDVNCKGDASGSATASATGGTADYTYSWNTTPIQNTAIATGLVAGTYTVTVTDAKGCTDTEQITISEPQNALLAAIGSVVDVNCKGDASGSATASATGGTADYTYSWNTTPIQNTAIATGLVAGTYTVTVTDAKGCTDTEQITINEPQNALLAAIGSVVDVNCKGDASGSATASATGGTADYSYSWNTTPVQNTAMATGLVAGTYTVTVTDAKGCTDTEQITISEPQNALLAAIGSVVDVNCKGDASGSATASATGGTADYTYSWNTTPIQNTAMATGLVAGTYTVTVTDAKGCTDTEQITISEPQNALLAAIGSVVDVNCKGDASGSATASATGGTADYTYSWNTTPIQNTAMATGLVAGTYTVTVTDAKGCTDTEQITISEPQNALLAAIGSVVDVNCKGDASGSATASATGGTADYTYSWNTTPIQNTAIATGLVAGTYTVTVTDAKGCTDTEQITINEPQNALLAAIGSVVDVNCKGDASGSATASATGGTADYTYSWNTTPVQNTAMATGLVAGTYTVTVTDAKGCTDTEQITISEPQNALLAAIGSVVDVNCKGDASGSATASATGGTADYTYSWNTTPIQNTAIATGLVAGTYTVTVTDAKGCTDTEQITINEPQNALLAAIGSVVDVNCKGDASGSATASATGGTADYSYSWNTTPVQNTAMATGLVAGTYTVTVTDAKGCTDTEQITISEPQNALLAAIGSVVDVNCKGDASGSATASATGGTADYTYSWNTTPIQNTAIATGLVAGTYTVTVTDAKGCTDTEQITINEPQNALLAAIGSVVDVNCKGDASGSATASATGGTADYSYSWNTTPVQNTAMATGLVAGTYTVTVTDAKGCTDTEQITISEPQNALLAAIGSVVDVNCKGDASGSATASATGGTADYTYSWNTTPIQNTAIATGLVAGTYTVTVTDAKGCTDTEQITINEPQNALLAAIGSVVDVNCKGDASGSATASATGGTADYSYSWNTTPVQNTAMATGLVAGTYTVTVTDAKGCTDTEQITISEPQNALLAAIGSVVDVNCKGNASGSATASATGGTADYTYSWNTTPVQNTAMATGLVAGTYTLTVTDAKGCTDTEQITINEPQNALLAAIGSVVDVNCKGDASGSATASATGGTADYTYSWNTTPTQNTAMATGLVAGTYTVTVTDAKGCTDTEQITINEPQNALLAAIGSVVDVNCKGDASGSATASATGGTADYTYSWNTTPVQNTAMATGLVAGTYTVTVTDAKGCTDTEQITISEPQNALLAAIGSVVDVNCKGDASGSATASATGGTADYSYSWNTTPVQNTAMATGLVAGTYTVTVTDAKGCTDTEQITISEPQNALLAAIGSVVDVNCKGDASGSATASATGGTADYTYSWNTTPIQNTAMATGLVAGTYTVTVTDAKGCTDTEQITISEPQNALLAAIGSVVDVNCKGDASGSATASATGGTADYTYSWNTTPIQNTAIATGLVAGTYTVTVTDAKGCTDTEQITINEPQNALLAAIGSVVDVNCKGDASGSATASATGGTADYTYSWNTTPVQNTAMATGLVAGTYTVTVTDAKGCTDTEQITISEPQNALLAAIGSVVDVNCKGDASGSATASATGGTADYTYSWNTTPIQNTAIATGLVAGTYTVTVTDAKGCTDTEQITINEPQNALLAAIGSVVDVNCKGDASGSATASATGGTADYSYSWNTTPVQNTAMATGLVAGTYTVTVTDAKGCTDTEQITISEPQNALLAAIGSVVDVNCKGDASGSATASATGGTADYTYSWNTTPIQNTAMATGLVAGTYTVTVTDAKGCTDTEQITISEPQNALLAAIGSVVDVNCKGDASGSATASATGGTADYTYSWNTTPIQNTAIATGLVAGTYTVTVTDAKGCTDTEQITINEPQNALLAAIGSVVDVNCKGDASGSATASATGGTADYSYSWNTTPVQNTAMATGLVAGTYTVTVTDAKGCTDTEQITISEPQNALLAAIGSVVDVNCKGDASGSATASATGGTADYTYSWNTTPAQNTAMATGLVAGTYTVTVTDAKGCTDTEQITISEPQNVLSATSVIINNNNCTNCSNGSINLTVTGGTEPYTFLWTNGAATEDISSLVKGTYSVEIKDLNGCIVNYTFIISESSINITKDGNYVDSNQDGITNVGDTVKYNFVVTNTGTVDLTNVIVTDNNAAITGGPIPTLPVGASDSTTFSGSYVITQGDINTGYVYNLATVIAKDPEEKPVTDTSSDPTPCTICTINPDCTDCTITELEQTPRLVVIKTATTASYSKVGDIINYTIIIKNMGNQTLHQIIVKDPLTGLDTTIAILEPGASSEYSQSHTVIQNDLDIGSVTNVARADGFTPNETPIGASDDEIVNEKTNPIDAVDDNAGTIVGVNQITPNVINVLTNDVLNALAVNLADVFLTTVTSNPFLQLNPDGSIDVLPDAPVGTQTMTYQICEKLNNTNCDTAVVTVTIEAPTMTITGEAICINDVPYLSYTATANNFTPVNGLTLTWTDSNNNVIATMNNLPLNGKVPWPGAVVDENGNGIDWPGWVLENGKWIESADGFEGLKPTASVTFTLNPSQTIIVNYPPSDPRCTSRPTFKIDAVDDTAGPIDGINGATNVLNVFTNDTLNTVAVNPNDVTLTLVTPDPTGYMTMNLDGSIDLKDGTPAGIYTLVYRICENADFGNCDTATVTINVICNNTTKMAGIVFNAATNTPLANVPVTLIPQGTTTGPILIRITNAQGYYNFTGMPAGDYLLQVQDANLGSAYELFPVDSSLFFTTLEICVYQFHDFGYDKSKTPVLGDFVWYDKNENGIQDEWFDANNDGLITQNIPDANGSFDYSKWEWIDLNGDGSYTGKLNVGELNAAGFGNAKSPNLFVTGPNNYSETVIIGIQGYWRNRPSEGAYGDYTVELKMDSNLETQSSAMNATGLVKILPNSNKIANSPKTSKPASFEVCGPTNENPQTADVTATDQIHLDLDFGISCRMFANIQAVNDVYNVTQCSILGELDNPLSNDLLDGIKVNISALKFKLLSELLIDHIAFNNTGQITITNGVAVGEYNFDYQVCEAINPTNCATATITINVTGIEPITISGLAACNGDTTPIDLSKSLPTGVPINGTWIDTESTGGLVGNILSSIGIPVGKYKYEYRIEGDCPRSIFLTIDIDDDCIALPCKTIIIHNALSINEDGKNDYFQIENIEDNDCYKNFKVEIFNRWGVLVFERENYNNEGNAFRGRSEGRTTISKNEGLPTGTYFYIISYDTVDGGKTQNIKKDGYLYLVK